MSSRPFVLIESAAALDHARAEYPTARWVTMAPYVTEALRLRGDEPLIADQLVTASEADRVGHAAIDAARRTAGVVDAASAWPDRVAPGTSMVFDLHRAITAMMYKALILQRVRAEIGETGELVVVGDPDLTPVTGLGVQPGRFDTLFSTFAEALNGRVMRFDTPPPAAAQVNGDFAKIDLSTRTVTFLNAPATSLFNRMLRRIARRSPCRFRPGRARMIAGIFGTNELVEEIVASLAAAGSSLMHLPRFPGTKPQASPIGCKSDVVESVEAAIRAAMLDAGFEGSALSQAAHLLAERCATALGYVSDLATQADSYAKRLSAIADHHPLVVLANSMTAPSHQILAKRFEAHRVTTYVVEHGTGPGLDENHDALQQTGLTPPFGGAIFYNDQQRQAHDRAFGGDKLHGVVAGAPTVMRRVGFRPIQRRLARRHTGRQAGVRVIAWLTGLYPNNMPFLPHYYRDGSYHELRRTIVTDVLGKLDDRVVLKLYPTFRHTDPDPFSGLMRLPNNCHAVDLVDFRNLRADVDVILLDEPGSALAWCWGTGVPMIYLDTQMRLNRESAKALSEAVFYVDSAADDWIADLRRLLETPHSTLVARWRAKEERRREVSEHLVLGPRGRPGRRAASEILDVIESGFVSAKATGEQVGAAE